MFKTKRFLLVAVMALMSVLILAACGSDDKNNASGGSGSSSDGDNVLERIKERDKIVFGVKYDTSLFGLKNPSSGEVEGFDIDVAKH